ncbi:hypothetical protein LAUMK40_04906 [Mycobacterium kansasii]|nr:hypothetical protein LAUMK40_04906 [Mycobacterium kansasii]
MSGRPGPAGSAASGRGGAAGSAAGPKSVTPGSPGPEATPGTARAASGAARGANTGVSASVGNCAGAGAACAGLPGCALVPGISTEARRSHCWPAVHVPWFGVRIGPLIVSGATASVPPTMAAAATPTTPTLMTDPSRIRPRDTRGSPIRSLGAPGVPCGRYAKFRRAAPRHSLLTSRPGWRSPGPPSRRWVRPCAGIPATRRRGRSPR